MVAMPEMSEKKVPVLLLYRRGKDKSGYEEKSLYASTVVDFPSLITSGTKSLARKENNALELCRLSKKDRKGCQERSQYGE